MPHSSCGGGAVGKESQVISLQSSSLSCFWSSPAFFHVELHQLPTFHSSGLCHIFSFQLVNWFPQFSTHLKCLCFSLLQTHGCPSLTPPSPPQRFWKLHPNSTWSPTYQAIKGWISFLPSFQVPRFSPVASQRLVAFHGDFLDFWRKKLPANARHLPLPSPALTHQEVGSLDL